MIQQEYKNNVQELAGDIQVTGFSIEVNESMFQMLTSNVYNDPILAVMREWSTNACDACIAAETEVQFDVHLPTLEEPTFFVRDYGTGLKPEDIVGLFSNLGASTKRNSNAYNGTLGIGRMAGLAVADAFTVESFYNGTHYSYVISMQNGVPVTMHLGNQPTTEPNGLKLSIAVDFDDIEAYTNRAERLYKFFDHKPKLNKDNVNIHLNVSEHISDNWYIMSMDRATHRDNNWVVMSQVAYEIPYNTQVDDQGFKNLVIKAPPGSVTFNPGRESLSLNKATIEYLNKAFLKVKEEYVQAALGALALAQNDYELMNTYSALLRGAPAKIASFLNPTSFASQEFKNLFGTRGYYHNNSNASTFEYLYASPAFDAATANTLALSYKSGYYKNSKPLDYNNAQGWREFFYAKHVIVDIKSKFRAAINDHYSNQSLITWTRKLGVDVEEATQQAKNYLDKLGISYTLASDLIDNSNFSEQTKAFAPREGFYASTISGTNVYKSEKMEDTDVETNTYLYLKLKNTTPIIDDPSITFEEYQEAYNLLATVTTMPEVKGVAKKYQDFVEQLDNWIDYETYIKEKMAQTTFKVPFDTPVPRVPTHLINMDNYQTYPYALQEYYFELRDYHAFNADNSFIPYETTRELAKKLGANFISYQPQREVDLDYLETTFKESFKLLSNAQGSYYDPKPQLLAYLAKLEEFYALHSS